MRSFRLGRCIYPLASRPQCCGHQRAVHDIRRFSSVSTARAATEQAVQDAPAKRRPGRPRKAAGMSSIPSPMQSNIAAAASPSVQSSLDPFIQSESTDRSDLEEQVLSPSVATEDVPLEQLPSPPPSLAPSSAKLSALHARLHLPQRLPLQILLRCLIHPTADPDSRFNNASLSILGNDLLGHLMAEHLLTTFPRLPMAVLYATQSAYVAPRALLDVVSSWGVDVAAEPGGEVDPGLLQFKRAPPGAPTHAVVAPTRDERDRKGRRVQNRRGMSSRVVYDDQFGELQNAAGTPSAAGDVTDLQTASAHFFRAVAAAVHLHGGPEASHAFFRDHILSRQLDVSSLFTFTNPTRDLARLCAREGFEAPLARLVSETGRLSRHPVFVVGIYSGKDELGQGAGASLDEARFRAAVAALKGWYLYSPAGSAVVPSLSEQVRRSGKEWKSVHIDCGEIVV